MSAISISTHEAGLLPSCADGDSTTQVPGITQTYTTAPFGQAQTLAGPIAATVYATATTTETQWVAEVQIVTPDGSSYPLTEGALHGSQRAIDPRQGWSRDGVLTYPFHVFTQEAAQPVVPGRVTRYDIQVFPTLATIPKGDRLRVTLATADTPHLVPLPEQLAKLACGVYSVQRPIPLRSTSSCARLHACADLARSRRRRPRCLAVRTATWLMPRTSPAVRLSNPRPSMRPMTSRSRGGSVDSRCLSHSCRSISTVASGTETTWSCGSVGSVLRRSERR